MTPPARGVVVVECERRSPAHRAGVRSGDRILCVDGHVPLDSIDLLYFCAESVFLVEVCGRRGRRAVEIARDMGEFHGMHFEDPPIRSCANRCDFCYVTQTPPGIAFRKGLSIRDDDYRHSFLHGHYVTLTNLSKNDIDRIVSLRLSPLYVSVHATDPATRHRLFGRKVGPIMPLLERFTEAAVELHAQIVIVPGVNDGKVFRASVENLHSLHPSLKTVAAVPVGLTSFHHPRIPEWTREAAESTLLDILKEGERYPAGFLQAADEWFSMLGLTPPPARYYGDFDVEENGVGMLRKLIDGWKRIEPPKRLKKSCLIVTGRSPELFLRKIVASLSRIPGFDCELASVENTTFGRETTVTGLLAWRDIRHAVISSKKRLVYIPDVMLSRDSRFLDNVTLRRACSTTGTTIIPVPSGAEGLKRILEVE